MASTLHTSVSTVALKLTLPVPLPSSTPISPIFMDYNIIFGHCRWYMTSFLVNTGILSSVTPGSHMDATALWDTKKPTAKMKNERLCLVSNCLSEELLKNHWVMQVSALCPQERVYMVTFMSYVVLTTRVRLS